MTTPGPDERLSAYFDGELSAVERADVERLLTERSDLQNELNGLADLSLRLNDLAEDLPDFDLRSRVLSQIGNSRRNMLPLASRTSSTHRRSWMPLFLSVSSLALLAAVMWPLLLTSDNMPQLAQQDAANAKLSISQPASMKATVAAGEDKLIESSEGRLVATSDHFNLGVATSAVASQDGKGPSVILAQIEKTRGLKAGEIVSRMIESGDTPMLAEYTVVDVRRTAQDVEILLKEHDIQPLVSPEHEALAARKPTAAKDDAETSLRVYLLDADSVSLNTAIMECQGLQEVVATNVDHYFAAPYAGANTSETAPRYQPYDLATPAITSDALVSGVPESEPPHPADESAVPLTSESSRRAGTELHDPPRPSAPASAPSDQKNGTAETSAPAKSVSPVIAGNSLVVENSVEVYAELKQVMSLPKLGMQGIDRAQMNSSRPVPSGVVELKVNDDLNAITRPQSRAMPSNLKKQNVQQQQQINRNRQRAFLVLRGQAPSPAPALPPEPPQPVPVPPAD